MTAFVEKNPVDAIARGGADDTAQFLYRTWWQNKGAMPDSSVFMKISPYLVIFDDDCVSGDSPEILFYGAETLFSERYPEAECLDHTNPKQLLEQDYRRLVCEGYAQALYGEPVFETIGTGSLLGPRKPELIYDRMLLKFRKRTGSYLIGYTIKRCEKWLSPPSNLASTEPDFQRTPGFPQSCPARSSSGSRLDARP